MQSSKTMPLFTTTPARVRTPMPVMITPNRMRQIINPHMTPIIDRGTVTRMISGMTTELN